MQSGIEDITGFAPARVIGDLMRLCQITKSLRTLEDLNRCALADS